MNVIAELTV